MGRAFPPVHVFFFALYPVLFLYAHNVSQTEFRFFLTPAFFVIGAALFLFYAVGRFLRDPLKAGLTVSLFSVIFFSYGHCFELIYYRVGEVLIAPRLHAHIKDYGLFWVGRGIHVLLIAFFGGLFFFVCRRIKETKADFSKATRILNFIACFLVLSAAITITSYLFKNQASFSTPVRTALPAGGSTGKKPDIYYIVLDGYARGDVLKEHYYFDNLFLKALRAVGFFVADKSRSNYSETVLSLASSLNLDYLEGDRKSLDRDVRDERPLIRKIRDNEAARFLKSKGYTIVHVGSTWTGTLSNPFADKQITYEKGFFRNEFYRVLFRTTFLRLVDFLFDEDVARTHLFGFEEVPKIAKLKAPTFTFAHFVLPHDPYVFDQNGNIIKNVTRQAKWDAEGWQNPRAYVEQLIFTNKKMLRLIRAILAASPEEPIIILQSDHGMNLVLAREDPRAEEVRLANLTAVYLPRGDTAPFYHTMTPVNLFRILFDRYFGTAFGRLEDRTVYTRY